jgi:metal-dependent hydrolase (beta-lactamase superfamily II)
MKNKNIDMYYTGHCTGSEAFDQMKKILNTQLAYFHPGVKINL